MYENTEKIHIQRFFLNYALYFLMVTTFINKMVFFCYNIFKMSINKKCFFKHKKFQIWLFSREL